MAFFPALKLQKVFEIVSRGEKLFGLGLYYCEQVEF